METGLTKNKKKDLGIFYTPQEVVNFIFEILNIWKNKEDKEEHRWQSRKPNPHYPSVIDPACGEGIFLKTAVTSSFTGYHPIMKTPYVFGVDLDGEVVKNWEEISILSDLFHGEKIKMLSHFYQQDGLLELPKKVFNYKIGGLKEFDAVVGNPPYGGIGFSSLKSKTISEITQILEHLRKFDIFRYRKKKKKNINQKSLWEESICETKNFGKGNHLPTNKEIESMAIEILFIDRFIQLAKPKGWIAIIIPDGILTNSNLSYVREFIFHRTKVQAIVSLPRETFKNVGTDAKTSILFLRKLRENEEPQYLSSVFLASIEKIKNINFFEIIKYYEKFYNSGENQMKTSDQIRTTKNHNGKEAVMVRVDKTVKEMMEVKPASRWDPDFWHPKYDIIMDKISKNYSLKTLGELLTIPIISPDHVRASKGEKIGNNYDCEYRTLKDLLFTGLNYADINYCSNNAFNRLKRSQLHKNDILFAGSGIGAIGRVGIVLEVSNKSCVGDLFIIRKPKINPFYLLMFFLTEFGQSQIERIFHGIQSAKISTDEISSIIIPEIPIEVQINIEKEYKVMSSLHNKAMNSKKRNDRKEYEEHLDIAKSTLKDLIKKTQEVIEGKQKDIN
jgi:hypothetical protein